MQQGAWDKLLELLARGDFDLALNGIEATPDKQRVALLSRPTTSSPERLTVRRGDANAPRTLDALRGRRVGHAARLAAERILRAAGAEVAHLRGRPGRHLQRPAARPHRRGAARRADRDLLRRDRSRARGAARLVRRGALRDRDPARRRRAPARGRRRARRARARRHAARDLRALGIWNAETARAARRSGPGAARDPRSPGTRGARRSGQPPFWSGVATRYPQLARAVRARRGAHARRSARSRWRSRSRSAPCSRARARSRRSRSPRSRSAYVELFRGTPLLVQLIVIYFGLPELGVTLSPFVAGVLALGLNYAAAESENYRAGLASVPRGAARRGARARAAARAGAALRGAAAGGAHLAAADDQRLHRAAQGQLAGLGGDAHRAHEDLLDARERHARSPRARRGGGGVVPGDRPAVRVPRAAARAPARRGTSGVAR